MTGTAIDRDTGRVEIQLGLNAATVATLQAGTEDFASTCALVPALETPEDYTFADALLTEIAKRRDAAVAMRKSATGPMYTAIKVVEEWFRPLVKTCDEAERGLKGLIGAYRLRQAKAEREARDLARAALTSGDAQTTIAALTVASEIAAPPEGKSTARFRWIVKRINPMLLPDDWWCPDTAKIEKRLAESPAGPNDDPPVIPGVVIEREAIVSARRK